jgi:ATPase subunit of ABC transporter with duplicated ATPase domains
MQERQNIENKLEFLAKEKKEAENLSSEKMAVRIRRFKPELCSENNRQKQRIYFKQNKILNERFSSLRFPKIIKPSFSLTVKDIASKTIVSINGGKLYGHKIISKDINLSVVGNKHLAVTGGNG